MLYDKVKKLCEKNGFTITRLERDLGFPRSYICKWNENIPSVTKVKAVADYLGCTVDELLKK